MIIETNAAEMYVSKIIQMRAMMENINEFLDTLPAPADDVDNGTEIPGVDHAWLDSVNVLHSQMVVASGIVDELSD